MMNLDCPHCQQRIELDESRRGRPARCPLCNGAFRAPLFDGEPAIAAGNVAGAGRGDKLLLFSAIYAVVGLMLIAVVWLLYIARNQTLPVPWNLLLVTLPLPLVPIGITWYAIRKTNRQALVWGARIVAYIWLVGHVYLTFKTLTNK